MAATIIDGKTVSASVKKKIAEEAAALKSEYNTVPGLAVIIVGNDPASKVYVRNKKKACEEAGFNSWVYELPEDVTQDELNSLIERLNRDENVHGILCQLPLPKTLSEDEVIARISPDKDVDAFGVSNVGKIMLGKYRFLPCTPAGVMTLLDAYGINPSGKRAVVIGRSNIVGKPMAMLLLHADATVTICHSKTENIKDITRDADILIAAVGRPKFVTEDMIKPGAVVIDVGINRGADGKLCGDVDFEAVCRVASAVTPVPGGVGPMTIAMLLGNTLTAAKATLKNKK